MSARVLASATTREALERSVNAFFSSTGWRLDDSGGTNLLTGKRFPSETLPLRIRQMRGRWQFVRDERSV